VTSAFLWGKRDLSAATTAQHDGRPWLVFCSPPYVFYQERQAEMCDLIHRIQQHAPRGSVLIVEADDHFDFELLRRSVPSIDNASWDIRSYTPAVVGLWRAQVASV
jgi:16S rRNA (guanine966-N2)-methyltransferase